MLQVHACMQVDIPCIIHRLKTVVISSLEGACFGFLQGGREVLQRNLRKKKQKTGYIPVNAKEITSVYCSEVMHLIVKSFSCIVAT